MAKKNGHEIWNVECEEFIYDEIHTLIVLIWNKEELPQEWKESIIVPIHKKGDRMNCNNYRGISLLSV